MAKQVNLPNGLSPQQIKFCTEYLKNGMVGSKAAVKAGYSYKDPCKIANRLLNMPTIKGFLEEKRKKIQADFGAEFEDTYKKKMDILWSVVNSYQKLLLTDELTPAHAKEIRNCVNELNKMEGHHSAERHVNVNVNTDIKTVIDMLPNYEKEF